MINILSMGLTFSRFRSSMCSKDDDDDDDECKSGVERNPAHETETSSVEENIGSKTPHGRPPSASLPSLRTFKNSRKKENAKETFRRSFGKGRGHSLFSTKKEATSKGETGETGESSIVFVTRSNTTCTTLTSSPSNVESTTSKTKCSNTKRVKVKRPSLRQRLFKSNAETKLSKLMKLQDMEKQTSPLSHLDSVLSTKAVVCSKCFQPECTGRCSIRKQKQLAKNFGYDLSKNKPRNPGQVPTHAYSALTLPSGCGSSKGPVRRDSFLNRCYDNVTEEADQSPIRISLSRNSSFANETHSDDVIVTPFAQIVHSLRSVRNNFISLTKSSVPNKTNRRGCMGCDKENSGEILAESEYERLFTDTLEELEWCLEQLEIIQTHRSVSEMATNKFKRMLNRELSHFAESSKAGNQISEYISSTFLDKQEDMYIEDGFSSLESSKSRNNRFESLQVNNDFNHCASNEDKKSQRKSPMLEITGVKRPSITPPASSLNLPKYGVEVTDQGRMNELMADLDKWGIEVFDINHLTNNRPLTAITYTIFVKRDLLKTFNIADVTLLSYLMTAEEHYRPTVPYHNSLHAADVTQSAHVLLNLPALQNIFTDLEILATIFACAIHDIDHPGLTNNYFITTGSDLALMYNDESVLENHHLAVAFKLLQQADCDFLSTLPLKSRQLLRRIVISIVLATDMNKHMDHVAHLKTMVEARKLSGADILSQENHSDRLLILQHLVHCADLSNPTKPLHLYYKWTDRIMEEFFRQGDAERSQNLDISAMCDRLTATVEKSQVGFIDYIVHPLWDTWAEMVEPGCRDILESLEFNREWYHNAALSTTSASEKQKEPEKNDEKIDRQESSDEITTINQNVEKSKTSGHISKESSLEETGDCKPLCFFILGEDHGGEISPTIKNKPKDAIPLCCDKQKTTEKVEEKSNALPSIVLDAADAE